MSYADQCASIEKQEERLRKLEQVARLAALNVTPGSPIPACPCTGCELKLALLALEQ